MNFIEQSEKNNENFLKEIAGTTAASGFIGRAGINVDTLFAGPFHPDYGSIEDLLDTQVDDRKKKIKDTDTIESNPVGGWYKSNTEFAELAYEELIARMELVKQYNINNTPLSDTEWKSAGWDYDYDDTYVTSGDDFINKSKTNMEKVGVDIKYDDKPEYAGDNFINKSKTNFKFVGDI